LKIDDAQEQDYEIVKISHIGFVDEYGIEGLMLLSSNDGREFHMNAFSGEVATHILSFLKNDQLFQQFIECLKKFVKKMKQFLSKSKSMKAEPHLEQICTLLGRKKWY